MLRPTTPDRTVWTPESTAEQLKKEGCFGVCPHNRRVCLVLYCSPLDKAAIFGVEKLPRIGV